MFRRHDCLRTGGSRALEHWARAFPYFGNFGNLVRAYTYIRSLGAEGLREAADDAVLNANYLLASLADDYDLPYDRICMHEVVLAGTRQKRLGVRTLDIAKRLIDYGIHPPPSISRSSWTRP